jgi:hypothetical protein
MTIKKINTTNNRQLKRNITIWLSTGMFEVNDTQNPNHTKKPKMRNISKLFILILIRPQR